MSTKKVTDVVLGDRAVGHVRPTYVIAEIGINHNGSVETAKQLIDVAQAAGCDCVKFQKRTPEICTPRHMWERMRETPWGYISYIEYRRRIEFGESQFSQIDEHCRQSGIHWTASVWDEQSAEFMKRYKPPFVKIPSAMLTNSGLLMAARDVGAPIMISTGMSTMDEITRAVGIAGAADLLVAHATSTYPCPREELNLRVINDLRRRFDCPIGYSGHETGLATTVAAVALGACFVERHVTLDRSMWGSDQAASIEPSGLARLVKDIRNVEGALGDGVKRVYESERTARERLRPTPTIEVRPTTITGTHAAA
ncbi:MAG: N-acetylneuraminate synthase family protein [Planctomycetota bacterium]